MKYILLKGKGKKLICHLLYKPNTMQKSQPSSNIHISTQPSTDKH